jgi:hypothetical protein
MKGLRKRHGENVKRVHARPIWFSDEQRLLSVTGHDTSGLQDRALLRLLIFTGARAGSLRKIRFREHIDEIYNHERMPGLRIEIPESKVPNGEAYHAYVFGDVYNDIRQWLDRRLVIHQGSPYLFITTKGGQLNTPGISLMIGRLSAFAGYGEKFFSSHSGRFAYACRRAAQQYSFGRSTHDILDELASFGHWSFGSPVILKYVKTSVQRFFDGRTPMDWEQFKRLRPEELHELRSLMPAVVRPGTWYEHDIRDLHWLCSYFGLTDLLGSTDQTLLRVSIANKLYNSNSRFRDFISSFYPSGNPRTFAGRIVNLMIEHGYLGRNRVFESMSYDEEEDIRNKLIYRNGSIRRSRKTQSAVLPRQVRHHEVQSIEEARSLKNRLKRRKFDRQLNVAYWPDGTEMIITHPPREVETHHVNKFPHFQRYEDESDVSPISSSESSYVSGYGSETSEDEESSYVSGHGSDTSEDSDSSEDYEEVMRTPPSKRTGCYILSC